MRWLMSAGFAVANGPVAAFPFPKSEHPTRPFFRTNRQLLFVTYLSRRKRCAMAIGMAVTKP
jgi:hypothetical protein